MTDLSVRFRGRPKGGRRITGASGALLARTVGVALWLGLVACQESPAAVPAEGGGERGGGQSSQQVESRPEGDPAARREATEPALKVEKGIRSEVERLAVKILAVHPHDPGAFTQGLVWDGGVLYESTGLYGKSSLRRVEPMTGEVLERRAVDPNLFAEGLARRGDRLLQLTWKAGIVLVYDLATLELIDEYGFNGQGWGLAHDGERLVMSDGTHRLTLRGVDDFRWQATVEVRLAGEPVENLNELEFAEGELYANVWGEERIVRIDPESGEVDAVIDASGLLTPAEKSRVDVLNGIAYDPVSKTFWLTGKFWPKMFQVVFVP